MEREEPLPRPAGHQGEAAAEATFDLDVVKLLSDALNGGTWPAPATLLKNIYTYIY